MEKRKRKLKKPLKILLKFFAFILVVLLIIFIGYMILISKIRSYGYSKKAAKKIISEFKISYAEENPDNKTLNAAFESDYYKEKNLKHYTKIVYVNHKDLIKNINLLLKVGYSDRDISIILKHGSNNDVSNFARHEKVKYLEEFYTYSFAKLKYYDRYVKYMYDEGDDEETTVIKVNLDLDKEDYTDAIKVNDYSKNVLANKHHYLGEKYTPKNLVVVPSEYTIVNSEVKNDKEAVDAAIKMIKAAKKESLNLLINSGYRSYKDQEDTYNTYKNLYGEEYCRKFVSLPGYSEHQTGYAFDFASGSSNIFANSKEYQWMIQNSYKYGYIYRFLKKKEDITGIKHEAWHFRYVGVKAAKIIDEEELSFEEYYAKYLDKN